MMNATGLVGMFAVTTVRVSSETRDGDRGIIWKAAGDCRMTSANVSYTNRHANSWLGLAKAGMIVHPLNMVWAEFLANNTQNHGSNLAAISVTTAATTAMRN